MQTAASANTPLIQSGARNARRNTPIMVAAAALLAVAACVALISFGTPKTDGPVELEAKHFKAHHHRVVLPKKGLVHEKLTGIVSSPSDRKPAKTTTLALTSGEETAMLDQHNAFRCMHGEAAFTWDADLASQSQAWADQVKADDPDTCRGGHSDRSSAFRNGAGENMAWGSKPDYFTTNGRDLTYPINMWYNEVQFYDFDQPGTSINVNEAIGHFTQVVWKGSQKVGCGMASCTNGQVIVCQYDPTGNYIGQYSSNVAAPTKTATECSAAGNVAVPCADDNTCADKASSSSGGGGGGGGDGGDGEAEAPTACEISAAPADTHCKISGTGCAGEQIQFTCKGPKAGGRWGAYSSYSALGYGFMASTDAFENDYTNDCEQCLSICEHEGETSCLDDPAPPPPPPPPPPGACGVSTSGAGGCVFDVSDCPDYQKISFQCTCKAASDITGAPSFCGSYPGYTVGSQFWCSLNTYTRDYTGGCDQCMNVAVM